MIVMNKLERVFDVELRNDGESNVVEGVAAVTEMPTDMGWYTEVIDRNAFNDTDMSDVILNFNHNDDYILAGTRNGSLQLWVDENGLNQRSDIIDTTQGKDVMKLVRNHLISKMSFRFVIEPDGQEWSTAEDGRETRRITKVAKLFDVSLVTFPAYPQTAVYARSEDSLAEEHRKLMERRKAQEEKWKEITGGKR